MRGMREMAATRGGMPMMIPEKVESPPRCWAYSLEEETIIKKDIYMNQ